MHNVERLVASVASIVDIDVSAAEQTDAKFVIRLVVLDNVDGLWSLQVLTRAAATHETGVQIHPGRQPNSLEATLQGPLSACEAFAADLDGLLATC